MIRSSAGAQTLYRALISSSEKLRDVCSQWQGYNYQVDSLWQGGYGELKVIGDKEAGRNSVHLLRYASFSNYPRTNRSLRAASAPRQRVRTTPDLRSNGPQAMSEL